MDDNFKTTDRYNRFNKNGEEILNPTPMQPPLGYKRTPSLAEQIRQQVHAQKMLLENMDPETEEEADDFEIEDDPVIESRWENDMIPSIKEIKRRGALLQRQFADYEAQAKGEDETPPPSKTREETASEPSPRQKPSKTGALARHFFPPSEEE